MIQISINGQMIYLNEENVSLYPMGVAPYTHVPVMYYDTT